MSKILLFTTVLVIILSLGARPQYAPVTSAPFISDALPGNVNANITVEDFVGIGAIHLELLYNPLVLEYLGATPNGAFIAENFSVSSTGAGPGLQRITISYPFGNPPVTLTDGSTLVTLLFDFSMEEGFNHSTLVWSDNGTSCEYRDAANNPLDDTPTGDFYLGGLIASQVAPVTHLPSLDFYTGGPFQVSVTADNFTDIGSISLTFEYDPGVITYSSTYASSLDGLTVDDMPGSGGKRKIQIGWFGISPETLPDGSEIVSIGFNYISGTTSLHWLDDGYSCDYGDEFYFSLYDSPTTDYYIDGQIFPTPAPEITADTATGTTGDILTVPVTAWGFLDINSMVLTLDYNSSVLVFECATLHPDLPGELAADNSVPGRLVLTWTSVTEQTLPDASPLLNLAFTYLGGTSGLTWYNSGSSCEFTTGAGYVPLTDIPTGEYYHNGLAKPEANPAIWVGSASSAWNTAANWDEEIVPESFFDVMITTDNSPPNWPAFTGDFTVGAQCRHLILEGAAQMTVTGDMTIAAGKMIDMQGSGLLHVGGDWINQGVFDPGTGSVDFYGTQTGEIPSGVTPGNHLTNYSWSTFTQGMTALTGAGSGPSGDNAHSDIAIGFTFTYLGVNYTQVRINTNGWLSLNMSGEDATSGDNSRMFYGEPPSTVLAPWWDDLEADGSSQILYKTEGIAPNRVFTAEWKNILSFSSDASARLNFQVRLYETSNLIEYCYGSVAAGDHSPLEGASIGLGDGGGGGGACVIEGTTGTTCNVITCLVSDSNWPGVNYRFTPPANCNKEIFHKINVSKSSGARLRILRDTHVTGL